MKRIFINLCEINKEGDRVLLAQGGRGGSRETGFSGLKGEIGVVELDLKLIADVGFVGFPNAGKSTLLSALSKAKPRIASYPFTTLSPELGTIIYPDLRQITLADLPGLIEGAHANIGLGHKFLKHVERTRLMLVVVDVGGFRLSAMHSPRSCLETIILLNKELELYKPELINIPAMLIVNKMDKDGAPTIYNEVERIVDNLEDFCEDIPEQIRPIQAFNFERIIGISARKRDRNEIKEVQKQIRDVLDLQAPSSGTDEEIKLLENIKKDYREHGPVVI